MVFFRLRLEDLTNGHQWGRNIKRDVGSCIYKILGSQKLKLLKKLMKKCLYIAESLKQIFSLHYFLL